MPACAVVGTSGISPQRPALAMYVDIADRRQFLSQLPKEDAHWKRIAQLSKES
ncbi:hypothetical protein CTP10_R19190 [Cupriavidus sp. P-10]|uniref:hypothetical protein n=1 Tax=unclassified Cupriavidus TaxID=2640874 RepID=UPI000EBD957C|nr:MULTISPECIES: hypothetical protein [unclassified Cupriavidus]BDB24565.1 hypothetical protein CTP10_R19190 [Cupriavidus sp. P-10]